MNSKVVLFTVTLLVFVSIAHSDSKTQTDWSGGSGEPGPDIQFGNEFYSATGMDYFNSIGNLTLSTSTMYMVEPYQNAPWSLYAADLDGDGDQDVIAADYWEDEVLWWENDDGTGTAWTKHYISYVHNGATSVCSDDIDGDGDLDVVSAAHWSDLVTLWLNADGSGTSWAYIVIDSDFCEVEYVCIGDVNGDGYPDILGASRVDAIAWWENVDGTGTVWTKRIIDTSYSYAVCIQPWDMDGDGDEDAVTCKRVIEDDVRWWENLDGTGTSWLPHDIDPDIQEPVEVFPVDLDYDGDCDVVGVSIYDDLAWWENLDGIGTSWDEHYIDQELSVPAAVYPADLDQDGDSDVIASDGYHVAWWENSDGSGQSWVKHTLTLESSSCRSLFSEDFNGDNAPDILGAGIYTDNIYWFELTEYPPLGELESSVLYLGNDPGWGSIDWTATLPAGTEISLLVRASDDHGDMGVWSDTLYSPGSLAGILGEYDSFFQYKVIFQSPSDSLTPTLHDITLSWTPVSIGETTEPVLPLTMFHGVYPNPVAGIPVIRFSLAESAPVEILVFDTSGRCISVVAAAEFQAGESDVQLDQLTPGVYLCRVISGDFTDTQRFVVIE